MGGYRTATRIGDTVDVDDRLAWPPARSASAGVIEPAELTLVSPLQSQPCVYYRASVGGERRRPRPRRRRSDEERAVGFRVRDASGDIRVFPRGARWDAPVGFDERTGTLGDEPLGLRPADRQRDRAGGARSGERRSRPC